jgi:hypothetical protein
MLPVKSVRMASVARLAGCSLTLHAGCELGAHGICRTTSGVCKAAEQQGVQQAA